ncbi:MAG: long-chain fatty acid--CoA ligase [Candidatus Jordarchaeales archaeon]
MSVLRGFPSTMMDDYQLNVTKVLENASKVYGKKEVVSRRVSDGSIFRYTYKDAWERVQRAANFLVDELGVKPGDRVGVIGWNTHRFFELYYAVPGVGAVVHEINLRLSPDDLTYIINHAGDRVLFLDDGLVRLLVESVKDKLKTVEKFVVMSDSKEVDTSLKPAYSYEALMDSAKPSYKFPVIDERSGAAMCYTTGTTGKPKGVVYSHRALMLHSIVAGLPSTINVSEKDAMLVLVPMFHVNAWGMPYGAPAVGAKLIFPAQFYAPDMILELVEKERATIAASVPTIWIMVVDYLKKTGKKVDLTGLKIVFGGSEPPLALMKTLAEMGATVQHAWGMTETTPLGTANIIKSYLEETLSEEEKWQLMTKQGLVAPMLEVKIVDETGKELPWDGKTPGELLIRGPWIAKSYYNDERSKDALLDGWFRTGDIATIDPEGYVKLVDRAKDLIKSGGEWISSVDLENAIMAHPGVKEATVIAVKHPKWQERPLAVVVPRDEYKGKLTKEEIIEFIRPKFAKWWLPDDVVFVNEIPKTSVGKFDKKLLREKYKDYKLPTAE